MFDLNSFFSSMKARGVVFILGAALFIFIFSPWAKSLINFWIAMVIATGLLAFASLAFNKDNLSRLFSFKKKYLAIGIFSAVILYLIFLFGYHIITFIFPSSSDEISQIYTHRESMPLPVISLLLIFWIGPGEEIFWRGFLQEKISKRIGDIKGWLLVSIIYALVHLFSFNFTLILAAFICGMFWGYLFNRYKSIWPVIISHATWDFAVFVILPFGK